MKKILLCIYIFNSLCITQVRIAAASNLYESLETIKSIYEATTGSNLYINYASSGVLTNQIIHSSNYDLFLSADTLYPKHILKVTNLREKVRIFTYATIVLWKKRSSLSLFTAKKIAIANPKSAPYGEMSLSYLKRKLNDVALKEKLIYTQNVSQVNQHIKLGSVDLAITSSSAQYSKRINNGVWEMIESDYFPQGFLLLTKNKNSVRFALFLFSKKAQDIFISHGYRVPQK